MAIQIWESLGEDVHDLPEAAHEAAQALADLYIEINNVDDLTSFADAIGGSDRMVGLGLVAAAQGQPRWLEAVRESFRVPRFKVWIEGDDLVWEGDDARPNPVGDHVDVVSGPGRGQRGVVRAETGRVAQVEFESGRRGHVERSALRTRGGR
jgi:hypothetical protein